MVARAYTVAFEGVEAKPVEVQCAVTPGLPAFSIVCVINKPIDITKLISQPAILDTSLLQLLDVSISFGNFPKVDAFAFIEFAFAFNSTLVSIFQ